MTVNIDMLGAAGAMPSERLDRHDADARQGRWAFELERALFAAGNKKHEQDPGAPTLPGAAARTPEQHMSAERQADAQSAQRVAQTGQAALGRTETLHATHVQVPHEASGDTAQDKGPRAAVANAHDVQAAPAAPAAAASGTAGLQHGAPLMQTGNGEQSLIGQGRGIDAALAAAASGSARAKGATPAAAIKSSATVDAIARQTLSAPNSMMGNERASGQNEPGSAAQQQGDSAVGEDAELPAAANGEHSRDELEAYAKKMMHVYEGADGMHAWIRDPDLQTSQVRSVLQALASQFAASGSTLAALSVNGKKVVAASSQAEHNNEPALAGSFEESTLPVSDRFSVKGNA